MGKNSIDKHKQRKVEKCTCYVEKSNEIKVSINIEKKSVSEGNVSLAHLTVKELTTKTIFSMYL